MALWLAELGRAYFFNDVPLASAAEVGRDFAYFAILLPLFADSLRDQDRRQSLIQVGAVLCLIAAGADAIAHFDGGGPAFLVHQTNTVQYAGIARVYTSSLALAVVACPFALGAALLVTKRSIRIVGVALTAICLSAIVLQLTRSLYVGVAIGAAFSLAVWLTARDRQGQMHRRQALHILALVVVLVIALVVVKPPSLSNSTFGTVGTRIDSIFDGFNGADGSNTVSIRTEEASALEHVLGGKWIFGLSFLDSKTHFFGGMPEWMEGSIRNSDVGILNIIMTMGLIGAALQLIPVITVLALLVVRRLSGREPPSEAPMSFGVAAFCVIVLASCLTQTFLYSPTATPVTAAVLGIGLALTTGPAAKPEGTLAAGSSDYATADEDLIISERRSEGRSSAPGPAIGPTLGAQ